MTTRKYTTQGKRVLVASAAMAALVVLAAGLAGCSSEQASAPQGVTPSLSEDTGEGPSSSPVSPDEGRTSESPSSAPVSPDEVKVDKFADVPADTIPQSFLPDFATVEKIAGVKLRGQDQISWGATGFNGVNYRQASYQVDATQSMDSQTTGPILAVISGPTYADVLELQRNYGWKDLGEREGMALLSVTQYVPVQDQQVESVMVMALLPSHGYISSATCSWMGKKVTPADMQKLETCAIALTKEIAANPV